MVCCWKFLFCREEGGVITLPVNTTYHKRSQPAIFTFQAVCECSNILPGEDCLDINDRSHQVFLPWNVVHSTMQKRNNHMVQLKDAKFEEWKRAVILFVAGRCKSDEAKT